MNKTILIIDDDLLVLKTIQNLLRREQFDLQIAKSAQEAQLKIEEKVPNLIICDVRMPQEDGISFLKKLRTNTEHELSKIPVIFVTGYASEDVPIDAIKLGAKDYILKPFDLDELLASIKAHIS
ncbi:MAG: hypothetical protein A3G33_02320 [Omnitrophica bacterium RIFCSPLOWO2_12_FULL_44_17]|uniref:Response regulatory domain-containing protein n=1 Tax=Candidatus Danuiimicrobium aquiferis TaxID=1801832 RepID=A0A1G1L152_9BACT|nr:MAG: hypothetical protein A3B72_01900 [Omnitrophica bacterium RIFCSPHIGHO2_02_FULL_45_28]OGW90343.1 MAG: hypothetical protein A3E74_01370 [Omnitrophica bacterium RIFCSPHIGHO2_12_FULL_44_12]OGW98875.1 MAG: hypothetical protein A3G33_02320 [Omnitrophica bacterium RIFCSPLOWO2_12_FULL_44_17]OGX02003.1 MAG: hypothetical protein A3J12_11315 [Omnitrophica bacterium RIFCSPLOWO2_02_FULL_44_11]